MLNLIFKSGWISSNTTNLISWAFIWSAWFHQASAWRRWQSYGLIKMIQSLIANHKLKKKIWHMSNKNHFIITAIKLKTDPTCGKLRTNWCEWWWALSSLTHGLRLSLGSPTPVVGLHHRRRFHCRNRWCTRTCITRRSSCQCHCIPRLRRRGSSSHHPWRYPCTCISSLLGSSTVRPRYLLNQINQITQLVVIPYQSNARRS
jgi:hypothetical protein